MHSEHAKVALKINTVQEQVHRLTFIWIDIERVSHLRSHNYNRCQPNNILRAWRSQARLGGL